MSKVTKSELLKSANKYAWSLVKKQGMKWANAFSIGIKRAKAKLELIENVCEITFNKVNGEVRTIVGTLKSELTPQRNETASNRAKNYMVLPFFDLEEGIFKSFRVDNLIKLSKVLSK